MINVQNIRVIKRQDVIAIFAGKVDKINQVSGGVKFKKSNSLDVQNVLFVVVDLRFLGGANKVRSGRKLAVEGARAVVATVHQTLSGN